MNRHTYICVPCRHVSRAQHAGTAANIGSATCPTCRQPMQNMGHNWRPPRKRDEAAWRRIEQGDHLTKLAKRPTDRPNFWGGWRIVKGRRLRKDQREPKK